jgi:fibrillarin-like pre-rRNA processing protein
MIFADGVLVSPGKGGVYGERMLKGYRVWDPYRSKLAALVMLGEALDLTANMKVLYLGAANGTTVSHVADYVDTVYSVEFAPKPMQDLLQVAQRRKNIVPVMADAAHPSAYAPLMEEVDLIYQDVAQPDQVGIARANMPFLREDGIYVLMLKTRSVDVRADPAKVFAAAVDALTSAGFTLISTRWLEPYHHDHAAIVCRMNRS